MKKIAILDYDMSIIGGVEKVACQLSNEFANYYDVYLISTIQKNKDIQYNINEKVHYINILPYEVNQEEWRIRKIIVETRKKIRKVLKDEKIDVLLCMGTYSGIIASLTCLGLKTKLIFCDHGALINEWSNKKVTLFRWISSIFSKKIVTLTDRTLNDYIKIFKTPKKKLTRIYNCIDEDIFNYVKDKYNIDCNKIISVGRLTYEKGFDMLVEIAKELKELNKNWQWDIYGDRTRI